jgi:hypothetical protein
MTQAITEEQPHDVANAENPPAGGNAPADDLDSLLQLWDDTVGKAEPASDISGENTTSDQTYEQQLADLLGPDPKVAELQGQVETFQRENFQRQEREAATKWAEELQGVVSSSNPNVEDDFVVRELKILSADNPGLLEQAWKYRGLTDTQLAIAQKDLAAAEKLYQRALAEPDSEQKQNALRYLEQRGAELQAMLTARGVIRNVRNEIRKRGDAVKAGYDEDVSAWRTEIAASMKNASAPITPEPPPDLGRMDDQTFRKWKLENLGWE